MSFNTREFAEPVAWRIELPDSQYFVDDIDDAQAVDDLTNSSAAAVPLYQYPDNSTHEELRLIHEILLCVAECPPVTDADTLTVRYVKDLCHAYNAQNAAPEPTPATNTGEPITNTAPPSPTPKTDAKHGCYFAGEKMVPSSFARQLEAENVALREACSSFRDTVLHERGAISENGMTNDQINDVLSEFDYAIDTAKGSAK